MKIFSLVFSLYLLKIDSLLSAKDSKICLKLHRL
ncbi:hypothetical protein HD_0190 [[Haemophilus] ducreyi 35000HP]|uniref:Uncharacterized protein n=1 Tax=Haemophilus ducreyi (strain 35000HP / ATCC 700724) TaxID=233412 RepID=Q7VPA1_HAEDU|nr:hypothetical protein HD_0190 [[Haemophilus] ducreyi 35000HP]